MIIFLLLLNLMFLKNSVLALDIDYSAFREKYPESEYYLGVGDTGLSENPIQDKRKAELYARAEIATQIKVKIKEEIIDVLCTDDQQNCRTFFRSVTESSVEETLQGAKIIDQGINKDKKICYAVAILSRREPVRAVLEKAKDNKEKFISESPQKMESKFDELMQEVEKMQGKGQ